jgi:hypothetical protein
MSRKKTGKILTIENAFEVNLPTLLKASLHTSSRLLVVDDSYMYGLVLIEKDKMTLITGGLLMSAAIVFVPCLKGRFRPLFKCPRAHEGNFQSLYLSDGVLACRKCHHLRYQSNLAGCANDRARIQRHKMMQRLGRRADGELPSQRKFEWRKKYLAKISKIQELENNHYLELRHMLNGMRDRSTN